ncbi:LysR family transcriptional regulator [Trinickia dabaoshanensis]|uniref:LysR family transcriptional regulator n=1 Tax=Trinickia dabaoshanensis TaxID=564714 RepID=A0A2N7VE72_9BURK|nr:LysR family transcriptional regulator [Trinickia dabaoshanensis]PMS15463.1 LysR family transcriptional regulator [Trinickia dabaoshanensis]
MLKELKTFLAVVRHGTFARAGGQIGLTQSAVSAQIQRLEDELGFALFDRTGRSANLNAAGKRTFEVAQELFEVYARLATQGAASESRGLLRVGAITSVQSSLLVDAIQRFRAASPGWRIRVSPGVSLNLLAQVDSGELDLAVIIKPPFALPSELKWHLLASEAFVLLVPRKLAQEPWRALLAREPLIRYDRNSFGGRLVDRFLKRMRINVDDVVELDELQGIVGLVTAGVGIAIVPRAATLHIPSSVRTLTLGDDTFYREVGIVERKTANQQGAAHEFAAYLRATVIRRTL